MKKQKEQLTQSVQESVANGNFAMALEKVQVIIEQGGNDPQVYSLRGDIYFELGNYSKAEQDYEHALKLRPSNDQVYFKLGRAMEERGQKHSALDQYQTALNFNPDNIDYKGRVGALLYRIGSDNDNLNYTQQGKRFLEEYVQSGKAPVDIRELLAFAYLRSATDHWTPDPNERDTLLATSFRQIEESKDIVQTAKPLISEDNVALKSMVRELEQQFMEISKKRYYGFNLFLKVPIVVGLLLLLFGATGQGLLSWLGAGLYYVSQLQPGFVHNRRYLKGKFRKPLALRRIEQLQNLLSQFSIFGSLPNVFLMSSMIRFVARCIGAMIVMVTLPYEIIKGFLINYNYNEVVNALPSLKKFQDTLSTSAEKE